MVIRKIVLPPSQDRNCLPILEGKNTSRVVSLTESDLPDLEYLYAASYPNNTFDPRMLESGQYFAIRDDSQILSVAGVHVFSRKFRVAALGNIAPLLSTAAVGTQRQSSRDCVYPCWNRLETSKLG